MKPRILVLGLGNPILTDDGVGVLVAEEVRARLPEDTGIDVLEVSVGGLTLMESMLGYERVILIDALLRKDGQSPGKVHKLTLDELETISPTQHSASPHDASLITALETGQRMGFPIPQSITIYAIEVENVMEFSEYPSPSVAAAIPRVTDAILAELSSELIA
ncbi:MAG: hydrogenase maturation protease [Chloroflexota bacterium]|nr:MAG: hydrogenase maturation protease [Chloroflexota bacterium]